MYCSHCGAVMTEGSTVCPSCGASQAVAAQEAANPAGSPGGGGTPGAPARPAAAPVHLEFDVKRWSQTDRIVGVATLVLFISLFLPWFGVNVFTGSYTVDGLYHGYMYITLLLSIAIMGYLVLRALWAEMPGRLPLPHERLLAGATLVNFVLTLISFIFKPGTGVGWRFGAFVGLIAAIVAFAPKLVPAARQRLGGPRR